MADKSSELILAALSRAAAAPAGVPLHGTRAVPGLFPTNAAGKQAAQRCQEDGYLCLASPEETSACASGETGGTATLVKKKVGASLCTITEKGLTYLLAQVSPRQVLEDFVRALDGRRTQAEELLTLARRLQQDVEAMQANADRVLQHVCRTESTPERAGGLRAMFAGFLNEKNPAGDASVPSATEDSASLSAVQETLRQELTRWHDTGASEDCPLPHLFTQLTHGKSSCTIGRFHDALRHLHDRGQIYLHPWTGPLYDIPEPPYALLVGHEIAYYASIRNQ